MSSIKALVASLVTRLLTSQRLQGFRRKRFALKRRLTGSAAKVIYFHQPDDPYSVLLAAQLVKLKAAYRIELDCYVVPAPEASAAPDLARLMDWSRRDADRLAKQVATELPVTTQFSFLPLATPENLARGADHRKKLGHYLGATLYFEGEWYWGLDRLHYLEQRLQDDGLSVTASSPSAAAYAFAVPQLRFDEVKGVESRRPMIHFFCSLRSPYTYLAAAQVRKLAEHYGADLQLKFVLPMVMRGLPVPWVKRLYILRDAKREAIRLGVPFGSIVDPVGKPVEAGLALLHYAIPRGNGSAMLESFLEAVFAQGIDAGSSAGLLAIAQRAGLTSGDVQAALADVSWRAVAETNRNDMLTGGIWGVPSFCVNDRPLLWGQDRLWMLEEDVISELRSVVHRQGLSEGAP